MIVTCPGCGSKYRVRDEAVPDGGAELQCPTCQSVFMAHPPKHSDNEISSALEKVRAAKDDVERRVVDVERDKADAQRRTQEAERLMAEAERRAAEATGKARDLESQLQAVRAELQSARDDARSRVQARDDEIVRLRDEVNRQSGRARAAVDAEQKVAQLAEELARARAGGGESARLHADIDRLQGTTGRLMTELEVARQTIQRLEAELTRARKAPAPLDMGGGDMQRDVENQMQMQLLQREVLELREQLEAAPAAAPGGAGVSAQLQSLVAAVGPMLWGLEQATRHLEPMAHSDVSLAAHHRHLQLLTAVLTRLTQEAQSGFG